LQHVTAWPVSIARLQADAAGVSLKVSAVPSCHSGVILNGSQAARPAILLNACPGSTMERRAR